MLVFKEIFRKLVSGYIAIILNNGVAQNQLNGRIIRTGAFKIANSAMLCDNLGVFPAFHRRAHGITDDTSGQTTIYFIKECAAHFCSS